jgi:hypothetical protein
LPSITQHNNIYCTPFSSTSQRPTLTQNKM